MKKTGKRILIVCISIAAVIGLIIGIRSWNQSQKIVDVLSVSNLNGGYYEDPMSTSGIVVQTDTQSVTPSSTQIVKAVYVSEGQAVKAGDPLIGYDITSLQLTVDIKNLEVQTIVNNIAKAQNELKKLQSTTPIASQTPVPSPTATPAPVPTKDEDAWSCLTSLDQKDASATSDDGTKNHPYHFLLQKGGLVHGTFLNAMKRSESIIYISIEIREGNTWDGELDSSITLNSADLDSSYENSYKWNVLPMTIVPGEAENPGTEVPQAGYTAEGLAKAINQKQRDIKSLDLNRRKAELELTKVKSQLSDGIVYAEKDGTAKNVHTVVNPPQDGSPYLTVISGNGVTISGAVSELLLDKVAVGETLTATSWTDGKVYQAQVTAVSREPEINSNYYSGNSNVSYYGVTAHISEAVDMTAGTYLQLTFQQTDVSSSIYLPNAYLRKESGRYYVMKDNNGVLVKQYVETGKSSYGYSTEIKSGLTTNDYVAFPYGDGDIEGVKTKISNSAVEGVNAG